MTYVPVATKRVNVARARIAYWSRPDHYDQVKADGYRRELELAKLQRHVEEVITPLKPLTSEERARFIMLLVGGAE